MLVHVATKATAVADYRLLTRRLHQVPAKPAPTIHTTINAKVEPPMFSARLRPEGWVGVGVTTGRGVEEAVGRGVAVFEGCGVGVAVGMGLGVKVGGVGVAAGDGDTAGSLVCNGGGATTRG